MTDKPNESELLELRKAKLDELRSSGNAFPNQFKRDSLANDFILLMENWKMKT